MSLLRRRFGTWLRKTVRRPVGCFSKQQSQRRSRRTLLLESLEERLTPAITGISLDMNNLLITDLGSGNGGFNNDTLTIQSDNANNRWIISDPNTIFDSSVPGTTGNLTSTVTIPFASVSGSQILVHTLEGNDSLTVDRSLGSFNKTISYEGGDPATGPGDKLVITGGSTVNDATVNYFNTSDGVVTLDGVNVQFKGLEPLDLSGVAVVNYTFSMTDAANNAILEDDGSVGNNVVQLRSLNGSFETTQFQNPSSSLTINMNDDADIFNVSSVAPPDDFNAALTVDGNGDNDTININGPLNLGANSASFTAETINVSSTLTTTGNIDVTASNIITGTASGLLQGNIVTLTTGTSIGSLASPVRTDANSIVASSSGIGGIFLSEVNSITLTSVSTTDGDIVIEAGTSIVATSIVANGTGRNVRLQALGGDLTIASITANGDQVILNASGAVLDGNGAALNVLSQTLSITSGTGVGTGAGGAIETQLTGAFDVSNTTGNIFVDNTGNFLILLATTSGNITLNAINGNLTSEASDPGVADIIGSVVTLNATGTGTIGQAGPQFLEVNSTVLNASTANQTMWISEVNAGSAIGLINAGAGNVFLRLANGGAFTSQTIDNVADLVGAGINLSAPNGGAFGTSFASPLEINATSLTATIAAPSTGMWFRDTAGGLAVPLATTVNAVITLQSLGGSLNLTTINAGASIVRLDASGAVTGTVGGTADVTAGSLRVNAGTGITLETAVQNLAFANIGGAVQIANTGSLAIANVAGLGSSTNTGTTTTVSASSPLTVAVNTISAGTLTLTAGEISDFPVCADDLTINPGITVQSTGGNVVLRAGDDINTGAGSTVQAAGSVTLTAAFGDLDSCGGLLLMGNIISGSDLFLTAINDICIGGLTAPGLVSITSTTGAIIDCNDPPAGTLNITSNQLLMRAFTGIGSPGSIGVIETNVNFIEAQTTTGGIFIADQGSFDVGGVDPTVFGIRNTGVTGNINLSAGGTINIISTGEIVRTVGDVVISAQQDVVTGGPNPTGPHPTNPLEAAISSTGGTIQVTAGRDLLFGINNGFGDVRAASNVTLQAGRDIILDSNTYVDAGFALAGGNLVATAGANIRLLNNFDRWSRFGTFGGTITLTTGPGGELELNTSATPIMPNLYGIRSDLIDFNTGNGPGGNITINADDVEIVNPDDIISAGSARVTIQPVTAGRPIDLGTNGIGTNLGLTDFELDRIVAGVVTIGSAISGPISVTNAISPAQFSTLHLITPSTISSTAAGTIQIANLAAQGAGGVTLTNANTVGTLAGTTSGTPFSFTNTSLLTVGTVDGIVGIATAGGTITLISTDLNVISPISAGAGDVNLHASPLGAVIGVGTSVGTLGVTYGISDAELALISSTGVIQIGDGSNTGGIQVAGSENLGSASLVNKNLNLVTGQHITVLASLTGANRLNLFAGQNINHTANGILGATLLTLDFGRNGTGATATITGSLQSPNIVSIFSGSGDDTLLFNFTNPAALPLAGVSAIDSGGNDLLDGPDFNQLFTLTGANAGTMAGVGGSYQGTVTFSDYENLAGGTADDRFLFLPAGSVAGNIDGTAGGVNKLDYTQYGSTVIVNLQTSTATAIGGTFANMNSFCGFSAPGICSDLIGANIVNDWQITNIDAGTINAFSFMGFGNLFGGTDTDVFTFGTSGQLNCNIDGGAGNNTIVGNNASHTYSITGVNSGAIDTLFIGSIAPVLPNPIPCPTSIITPAAPDTRFTNVQNLTAGSGNDRFFFLTPGSLVGMIDGGAGNNTLYGDNVSRTYTVTGAGAGNVTGILPAGFTNVQNLIAGTGNDIFTVNSIGNANMTMAGVQGGDLFAINNTGTGQLTLCGGDDTDFFVIQNTGSGAVIASGDDSIDDFTVNGTTGPVTLSGNADRDFFTINGTGAGLLTATGDDDLDTFTVNAMTGPVTLNGNAGNDRFFINGTGPGLLTASGDDDSDLFAINQVGVGGALFNGDNGIDTFIVHAVAGETTINAGADSDLINVGSTATSSPYTPFVMGGNLDGITATLNLNADTGVDAINLYDQTAAAANTVEFSNSSITGFAPGTINYSAVSSGALNRLTLTLVGSGLGDTFNVRSTLANPDSDVGDFTRIVGGVGNDRFNLGSTTNLLDGLLGLLSVQGESGINDQVCFFDQGQTIAYNYSFGFDLSLSTSTLIRTGGAIDIAPVLYSGMELLKAEAGSGDDNFEIQAIGATTSADIKGNAGDDQFQLNGFMLDALPLSLTTNLLGGTGNDRFFVQTGPQQTPGKVNMIGETDDDQFSFLGFATLGNGCINGGDGIDTIDYSNYSAATLVNLRPTSIPLNSPLTPGQQKPNTPTPGLPDGVLGMQARTASGLVFGSLTVANAANRIAMASATDSTIENIVGSPFDDAFFGAGEANRFEGRLGADYLFGGEGDDILIGNEGDDTIFGEAGADTIYGAGGRDAMYAGTQFDIILIDDCNDVRPGLNSGDRVLDLGGLGADGGIIDLVVLVPPLTGTINDPRINWSNDPLEVFQVLAPLRPISANALIQQVNHAPVLDATYTASFTNVAKGATSPSGNTVASIVGSSVSDVDVNNQAGIAVFAAPSTNGQWQYSLDGGTTWIKMGTVTSRAARLLRMTDLVRFVPKSTFTGTVSISYVAWDQTSGSAGGTANLANPGGTTAFSTSTDSATVTVSVINAAPVLNTSGTFVMPTIKANATKPASVSVSTLLGKNVTDANAGALKGIAITKVDGTKGTWQYSINDGKTWSSLTTANVDSALLLRSTDLLRFVPTTGTTGPSSFGFHAWDRTNGSAGTLANLLTGTGGTSAFSTDQVFAQIQVGNTAPMLNTASPFTLNPFVNGSASNPGTTVEALLGSSVTDPDLNAKRGIAVTGLSDAANGKWQFSTNGGKTWQSFGTINAGSARLLRSQDMIRFVPNANFHGQVSLQFQAWDQTAGVAGTLVKLSAAAGSNTYSSANATAGLTIG